MQRPQDAIPHAGDVDAVQQAGADSHPYGSGDHLVVFALAVFHVNGLLMRNGESLAGVAGQSSARWQILGRASHRPRTVAQMARELGLARQSVQAVADALEATGLVAYADNPTDRRARLVTITAHGSDVLARIEAANAAWARRVAPQLSLQEVELATSLLHRIGSVIEHDLDEWKERK